MALQCRFCHSTDFNIYRINWNQNTSLSDHQRLLAVKRSLTSWRNVSMFFRLLFHYQWDRFKAKQLKNSLFTGQEIPLLFPVQNSRKKSMETDIFMVNLFRLLHISLSFEHIVIMLQFGFGNHCFFHLRLYHSNGEKQKEHLVSAPGCITTIWEWEGLKGV